jgi:hypothetical protein
MTNSSEVCEKEFERRKKEAHKILDELAKYPDEIEKAIREYNKKQMEIIRR